MQDRDKLIGRLNKEHGDGHIFLMDSRTDITKISVLPTGSLALDNAIGVGGFPRGRVVEIYGPEATGKSMLSLSAIAHTQKIGGYAAFIDVEHALSPKFARLIGVDTTKLYYSQPDDGAIALTTMEELISSSLFDIVVLDSVAALVTEGELEGKYGDNKIAPTAILMSKALKRMTATISRTKTVAIFINQLREKPMVLFGSPEYTTGGKALKFYASVRIDVRIKKKEYDARNKQIAHDVTCKIVKNKVAPPFDTCHIRLDYTKGIDEKYDIIETAIELGMIVNKSSWYYIGEEKFAGKEALYAMKEETLWPIRDSIKEKIHSEKK